MAKAKTRAKTGIGKIMREARQELGPTEEHVLVPQLYPPLKIEHKFPMVTQKQKELSETSTEIADQLLRSPYAKLYKRVQLDTHPVYNHDTEHIRAFVADLLQERPDAFPEELLGEVSVPIELKKADSIHAQLPTLQEPEDEMDVEDADLIDETELMELEVNEDEVDVDVEVPPNDDDEDQEPEVNDDEGVLAVN